MASLRKFTKFILYLPLLVLAIMLMSDGVTSAHAQSHVTPTPTLRYEATKQAAQAQKAEADRLDAQAAEMRRNADAQQAAAQQAINDARAAAIAQDSLAMGEAIGRAENELNQLRTSLDGIAQINAGNVATVKAQSSQIISLTAELQQVQAQLRDARAVNQGLAHSLTVAQVEATPSPVVPIFAGAVFVVLIGIIVMLVLEKWRGRVTLYVPPSDDDVIDMQQDRKEGEQWSG